MDIRHLPPPAGPDHVRRIKIWTPDELGGQHIFVVPPWGYLEGFEVRMRELVPNMDASYPLRLGITVMPPNGHPPYGADIAVVVRDVLDHGAGPDPLAEAPRPGDTTLSCPSCGETLRGHLELHHRRAG